jgi:purine nucleosidase
MSEPEASARTSGMGVSGPVLSARGIVKTFGPVVALEGVDLDLHRGEVLAIIGDNGAGKSTLIKCLTGAEIADVGEIRVDGKVVKFRKPQDARDAGIETVYQTLSLSPALDIASNLFLGRERVRQDFLGRWLRVLDKRGMCRDAEAKVATLGIRTIQDINQVVETLSGGQRQAVAVARAVAFGGKVIVLDEPTAALGVREARQVLDIVQQLRTRGLGIILISHNMPQVFEVADRIHIQRLGRCAGIITPQTHTMPQAVAIMTGAMSIGDSFLGASAASARGSNSAERQRTMSAPSRRKIILDTDPAVGIPGADADDPLALMLALKDPRLDLLGVTTVFGNCPPALGARCAAAVLRAAGREDVPIAIGMDARMNGELPQLLRDAYAGDRGRPGRIELPELIDPRTDLNAVDFLIETVLANPGEVTIVAIGPQTNLALALLKQPRLREEIGAIVFMGGALGLDPRYGRGNITPVAECNIWFDPQAADIVFRSGIDLTMVSLDVTNPSTGMVLPEAAIRSVDRASAPLASLFVDICATYLDAPMFDWANGCVLYDPLAVAVAADPGIASFQEMTVGVETSGALSLGQTVPMRGQKPNMRVCVSVDGARIVGEIVTTILASPERAVVKANERSND